MANQSRPTPFGELKALLDNPDKHSDLDVFSHCLGLSTIRTQPSSDPEIARIRAIADQLAENMTVLCIDTEHYTLNSDEMTEIGVAVMNSHHVRPLAQVKDFGEHGENLMRHTKYHFWRLLEKSHHHTTNKASRGPAGNRFGQVRFVSFADARKFLRELMNKPIEGVKGLELYNHPVVILGHSIGHDRDHLNGKDLALRVDDIKTIVRYIDTQAMAVQAGHWGQKKDPIGLNTLVHKLEFEHTDSHTAANDAARTLVCAILLALPMEAKSGRNRSVNEVATDLERHSQDYFVGMGGSAMYCCKCGSTKHMYQDCDRIGSLLCDECVARGLNDFSTTHIALHCPVVRDEIAEERLAWYRGQPQHWQPKHAFSSKTRLKTFAEVPNVRVQPTSFEEYTARRVFYDKQRVSNSLFKPFVWSGRSFQNSPFTGPPPGQRSQHPLWNPAGSRLPFGHPALTPAARAPPAPTPSPAPAFSPSDFPALAPRTPGGATSKGGSQLRSVRDGQRGWHSGPPSRAPPASTPSPASAFSPSDFPAITPQTKGCAASRGDPQSRGVRNGRGGWHSGLPCDSSARDAGFAGNLSDVLSSAPTPRIRGDTPFWGVGRDRGRGDRGRGN